ncbi:hypothetical protein FCM35_KLT16361 [Carex littledalei]|uniref:Uncharacterized protein n=1 Tax=Carex littledalei TaxID=544730 RepID=A0A833R614_9POAL|nr:hypothetical protein FCM35_KLT16361 [Carex littledalei]
MHRSFGEKCWDASYIRCFKNASWVEIHIHSDAPKRLRGAYVLHQRAGHIPAMCTGRKMRTSFKFPFTAAQPSVAPKRVKNANELHLTAGVTFEKREHSKGFGVTFQNGILQIPHLQLDPNQITLLANLVTFKEPKPSTERLLTSYVLLVDGLINSKKDVELLQRLGLITNNLSSTQ